MTEFLNKFFNILNIQWIVLIVLFLFFLFSYVFKKSISKKNCNIIIIIFCLALVTLEFRLIPPESFDLYRHYQDMNLYRSLNLVSLIEEISIRPNVLWYIIIKILSFFGDNRILPFFTMSVTLGIFYWIINKLKNKFYLNNYQTINCLLIYFSIINLTHLMSGLRNGLAISIFSLGLYHLMFNNNKWGYLFFIMAFLIHPMTIILILFYLFCRFFSKIKFIEIPILLWTIFSRVILLFLSIIPLKLFELFFTKFNLEMSGVFGIDYRIFILEILQVIILFFMIRKIYVVYLQHHSAIKNIFPNEKNIIFYFYIVILFIIGSINMTNIFIRTRFVIAYFMPYLFILKNKYLGLNKIYDHLLLIISFGINIYYIYYMMCNGIYV